MSSQPCFLRPRLARLALLLASAALVTACGGGGGGGGDAGGGATPSQSGGTVPESAMASMTNFMRFMTAWKVDDTVEPMALSSAPPPRDSGDAWPVD